MSYSVNVKVTPDGVEIDRVSGTVPEGIYTIGGHEDESGHSISVSQYGPVGYDFRANAASFVKYPVSTADVEDVSE